MPVGLVVRDVAGEQHLPVLPRAAGPLEAAARQTRDGAYASMVRPVAEDITMEGGVEGGAHACSSGAMSPWRGVALLEGWKGSARRCACPGSAPIGPGEDGGAGCPLPAVAPPRSSSLSAAEKGQH